MKKIFIAISFLFVISFAGAEEGFRMPYKMDSAEWSRWKEMGFDIPLEKIYSHKSPSLKDAMIYMSSGCSGGIVSEKGLFITNHHCALKHIQNLSGENNNLLEEGFWAGSLNQELPVPGLWVKITDSVFDVTAQMLNGMDSATSEKERQSVISINEIRIIDSLQKEKSAYYEILPFYEGLKYFCFRFKRYNDVRFVGAPPLDIGKFGKITDNWTWPRHTADFSFFRIYADSSNAPAYYSPDNRPYLPELSLTVDSGGIQPFDPVFVYGFPGSTHLNEPYPRVRFMMEDYYPALINLRERKIAVIQKAMEQDTGLTIVYASPLYKISNSYKKWRGYVSNYKADSVLATIISNQHEIAQKHEQYRLLLESGEEQYREFGQTRINKRVLYEMLFSNPPQCMHIAHQFRRLESKYYLRDSLRLKNTLEEIEITREGWFTEYDRDVDTAMLKELLRFYQDYTPVFIMPGIYNKIHRDYKGDIDRYVEETYKKSALINCGKMDRLIRKLGKGKNKLLLRDPVFELYTSLSDLHSQLNQELDEFELKEDKLLRLNASFLHDSLNLLRYPNANRSLRISAGKIQGYPGPDAVNYNWHTTVEGIREKSQSGKPDYKLTGNTQRFLEYAHPEWMVNFISSCHTTSGNSGSPLLNAQGKMVGLNFDRTWQGTISDYRFAENARNISVSATFILRYLTYYSPRIYHEILFR